MKKEEAIKILALYDDINWVDNVSIDELLKYYLSLDNLVPVWIKLKYWSQTWFFEQGVYKYRLYIGNITYIEHKSITIQEAAAIATAKAIQELNKQRSYEVTEAQHD